MPSTFSETLWIRCGAVELQDVATSLEYRLKAEGDPINVVITGPKGPVQNPLDEQQVSTFIKQQKPTALIWLGGELEMAVLSRCLKAKILTGVAELGSESISQTYRRSLFRRKRISEISFALVQSSETSVALSKDGVPIHHIEEIGELMADPPILPYNEEERHSIAQMLGTRPIWLAAGVRVSDVPMLVAAHKRAARAAHRIVTAVVPAEASEELAGSFEANGLTVAQHTTGKAIDDAVEVYLTDEIDDLGLFLRLASLTFIGGTFDEQIEVNPYCAAALGCAIVAGPKQGRFKSQFAHLSMEGAILDIASTASLGDAVIELLSVERTAKMAHAGWQVVTNGVASLDRLEELTRTHLLRFES